MSNSQYKPNSSAIRNCRIILDIPKGIEVSDDDVEKFKTIIHSHLYEDMLSPKQIATKYGIVTDQFHVFISKTLGIKLRNNRDATRNRHAQMGTARINDKEIYRYNCRFTFSPYKESKVLGYELLSLGTFSTPQNKVEGGIYLHRDHMVSVSYGYENSIDPKIISHPANCRILLEKDNLSKSSGCSITIQQLMDRISNWNKSLEELDFIEEVIIIRSEKHKENIRKSLLGRRWYNDGNKNFLIKPENKKDSWNVGKI